MATITSNYEHQRSAQTSAPIESAWAYVRGSVIGGVGRTQDEARNEAEGFCDGLDGYAPEKCSGALALYVRLHGGVNVPMVEESGRLILEVESDDFEQP